MALSNEQYKNIEETVLDTFEATGISTFPIDVFELASKLKIKLKKYSDYSQDLNIYSQDAICIFNQKEQEFIIVYNDAIESKRINFTIMHEIGHIQLEHYIRNLPEDEKEREADIFAQKALAPLGVILQLGLKSYMDISSVFEISLPCAQIIAKNVNFIINKPKILQKEKNSPITKLFEEGINV